MTAAPEIPDVTLGSVLRRSEHYTVYRAVARGRECSVKIAPVGGGSGSVRMLRAARAVARSPGIVLPAVLAVGTSSGAAFVIEEWLAGPSLRSILAAEGPLPSSSVKRLLLPLAEAIAALDADGVSHGFVSLDNVLFPTAAGPPRLSDTHLQSGSARHDIAASFGAADVPDFDTIDLCLLAYQALHARTFTGADESGLRSSEDELCQLIARVLVRDSVAPIRRTHQLLAALQGGATVPRVSLREADFRRLDAAVQADGSEIILLRGPIGSGKTRLVEDVAAAHSARGGLSLVASCELWDATPFRTVRALFEGVLDSPAGGAAKLESAAGTDLAPLLTLLSPRLANQFPRAERVPHIEDSEHVFVEGLAECLARVLGQCPGTLLVAEDSQWLDEASLKVLKRLLARRAELQFSLILTMRDDRDSQIQGTRLLHRERPGFALALAPLPPSALTELVSDYLGRMFISSESLHALAHLTDGNPLSTLELLRAVLDEGLLAPHWGHWVLDAAAVARLRLPPSSAGLMTRKLKNLDPATAALLRCAAVLGPTFSSRTLVAVALASAGEFETGLLAAEQLHLVERTAGSDFRFVHRSVRETLLSAADVDDLRNDHRRIVEFILSQQIGVPIAEYPERELLVLAEHARRGECFGTERYLACFEAGRRSFASFDNARAAELFREAECSLAAESRASARGTEFTCAYYYGESLLRCGDLSDSRQQLERALEAELRPVIRALLLSRLACIAEIQLETTDALRLITAAFKELNAPLPKPSLMTIIGATARLVKLPSAAKATTLDAAARQRAEVLCALHYRFARLSFSSQNPPLVVEAALQNLRAAAVLGRSPEFAKACGVFGVLLAAVGRKRLAAAYGELDESISEELSNPVAVAHSYQLKCVAAGNAGEFEEVLAIGARCLHEFGIWMEPSDFCLTALTLQLTESFRGRGREAWTWVDQAISKALRYEGTPAISESIVLSAEAEAVHLGREREIREVLSRLHERVVTPRPDSGLYLYTFGPRLRKHTEAGTLGSAFDSIVAEFEAGKHDPRKVYILVSEYYLHLAHARLHQALRADPNDLLNAVVALTRASADLSKAARFALLKAHAAAVEGSLHVLNGDDQRADKLLRRAEELARQEAAPWVLYAVARARAHQFRRKGDERSAKDHGRIAQALAHEHGAVHRQRWVEEEFNLAPLVSAGTSLEGAPEAEPEKSAQSTRHLKALVNLSKPESRDLNPKVQASRVLDEMLAALFADRGFLWMREWVARPPAGPVSLTDLKLVAGRDAAKRDTNGVEDLNTREFNDVLQTKSAKVLSDFGGSLQGCSVVVTPLLIQEQVVGAACLITFPNGGHFTQDDAEVFSALASQVPVALQLADAVRDRDRLTEDLRHAQKMEAVGRLAGGIAHDFNNMLSAIRVSADAVLADPHRIDPVREELTTISGAADRAARLTRQLLTFSRRQVVELHGVDLNGVVRELLPMVRKLVGPEIEVLEELDPSLSAVWGDSTQLEQAIVNLMLNAKDAMPNGGRVIVSTSNEVFGAAAGVSDVTSDYAMLTVTDTGVGMSEEIRQRVFEPFFTTKGREEGTGLGLAMVYGIVRQCGGIVDIKSTEGVGTSVRICLPRTAIPLHTTPPEAAPLKTLAGAEKILLVEDEKLVRQALGRVLRPLGYQVLTAVSGAAALEIVAKEPDIRLVITDVIMPGMNGVELVQRLRECGYQQKILYISGYTDGVLATPGAAGGEIEFMQKPISQKDLAERVRRILDKPRVVPVIGQ